MAADGMKRIIKPVDARWISDVPQPGWVEVDFVDSLGQVWTVADKPSVFTRGLWTKESSTPPDCGVACDISSTRDDVAVIELAFGLASAGGQSVFTVNHSDLDEPFHVPDVQGMASMKSLESVKWTDLRHAYRTGPGTELDEDVASSLALLATDEFDDGLFSLYSNICHQGTIYPATAHAVPFLICFAAGSDISDEHVERVIFLLAQIWLSATEPTDNGSRSGAFGDGVGPSTHAAFAACDSELRLIRSVPESAELITSLVDAVEVGPENADVVAHLAQALDSRLP